MEAVEEPPRQAPLPRRQSPDLHALSLSPVVHDEVLAELRVRVFPRGALPLTSVRGRRFADHDPSIYGSNVSGRLDAVRPVRPAANPVQRRDDLGAVLEVPEHQDPGVGRGEPLDLTAERDLGRLTVVASMVERPRHAPALRDEVHRVAGEADDERRSQDQLRRGAPARGRKPGEPHHEGARCQRHEEIQRPRPVDVDQRRGLEREHVRRPRESPRVDDEVAGAEQTPDVARGGQE